MSDAKKKILHLSIGPVNPNKLPPLFRDGSWQNVRPEPRENADSTAQLTATGIADGSMDAVFVAQALEHLPRPQVQAALAEWMRLLKPGGRIVLNLPDMQAAAAYIADGRLEEPLYGAPQGGVAALDVVYGGAGRTPQTGFSAKTLARHLIQAGFSNVSVQRDWLDLWAMGFNYPAGHPERRTVAQIVNKRLTGAKGQRLPAWYEQMLSAEGRLPDELDSQPRMWKPLGLKREPS